MKFLSLELPNLYLECSFAKKYFSITISDEQDDSIIHDFKILTVLQTDQDFSKVLTVSCIFKIFALKMAFIIAFYPFKFINRYLILFSIVS